MFYIKGVKAYSCLSISYIVIQSRQYATHADHRTVSFVLCTILFLQTSSIIVLFTEKRDKYEFVGSLYGFPAPYCWNLVKKQNCRGLLRCRLNDFIKTVFSSFLSISGILFSAKIIIGNQFAQLQKSNKCSNLS